jgi:hypothetical protein
MGAGMTLIDDDLILSNPVLTPKRIGYNMWPSRSSAVYQDKNF